MLSGYRARGYNGGRSGPINIMSVRERNREMNAERVQTAKQLAKRNRERRITVAVQAKNILEEALKKNSLEERIAVIYNVQRGERMVGSCVCIV